GLPPKSASADRPVRRPALLVEHRGATILLGHGSGGGIAAAPDGLPGLARELVLAAELPAASDGVRVASGLAPGDRLERPAGGGCLAGGARAGRGRARGGRAGGRRTRSGRSRGGPAGGGQPERAA